MFRKDENACDISILMEKQMEKLYTAKLRVCTGKYATTVYSEYIFPEIIQFYLVTQVPIIIL